MFRDESELPVSEDLSKDIIAALDNSRYLIIVATPTYQASKWCMKELEYFRSLHGNTNHNIIPLLLEGEPEESFPSILREREKTIVDENGNQHTIIEEVEPLAADCRGATIAEQRRRLRKTECLRIAAPILGVAYDDLYRRHFRQSVYRGVTIAVVTLMVVLAFAALSISNQRQIAQERNGKLAAESYRLIEMANMEDDPTLAMMLAEQAFEVAPEDDSSHTRALEAFRTKTIDAAIADERSDLHRPEYAHASLREKEIKEIHTGVIAEKDRCGVPDERCRALKIR